MGYFKNTTVWGAIMAPSNFVVSCPIMWTFQKLLIQYGEMPTASKDEILWN